MNHNIAEYIVGWLFCGLQDGEKKNHDKSNSTVNSVQVEEQLSNHLHFRQEWAFTTLGKSRFESLLIYVAPERLLDTVGWSRFESLTFKK